MVRFIFQVLATVALLASGSVRSQLTFEDLVKEFVKNMADNATEPPAENRPIYPLLSGLEFGGTGNDAYTYRDAVVPGEVVRGVMIRAGKRVNGIGIIHENLIKEPETFYRGGEGGKQYTLTLGSGEYFTGIEAHTGEKNGRKRIFYIKLTTNRNNTLSGGTPTNDIGKESAPEGGYQIGGFYGKWGDELDSVAAIWASIEA